jgi:hypothetical protein
MFKLSVRANTSQSARTIQSAASGRCLCIQRRKKSRRVARSQTVARNLAEQQAQRLACLSLTSFDLSHLCSVPRQMCECNAPKQTSPSGRNDWVLWEVQNKNTLWNNRSLTHLVGLLRRGIGHGTAPSKWFFIGHCNKIAYRKIQISRWGGCLNCKQMNMPKKQN